MDKSSNQLVMIMITLGLVRWGDGHGELEGGESGVPVAHLLYADARHIKTSCQGEVTCLTPEITNLCLP